MRGDGKIFNALSTLGDMFILNVIYLVTCIPIITFGAATTALYYTTLKMAENRESYVWREYFNSFKSNFRQATIIWVIYACLCALVAFDYVLGGSFTQQQAATIVGIIAVVLTIFLALEGLYVFPLLARFDNTVMMTMRNALLIAVRNLHYTIVIALIHAAPLLLAFVSITAFLRGFLVVMLFTASILAYLESKLFVRVFYKYYPKTQEIN